MSTRQERKRQNRKAHAARLAAASGLAPDPLDETYRPERAPLAPIPWNKVALDDRQRGLVARALLDQYPRNEIAAALGLTVKTLKRLIDDDPVLADAVDAAREAEEAELRDLLMRNARDGDTVSALFLLKARHGYRDRDDKAKGLVATGGVLVVPGTRTLEEWSAAAYSNQAKFRERRPEEHPDAPGAAEAREEVLCRDIALSRPVEVGEGMRRKRPRRGELPN